MQNPVLVPVEPGQVVPSQDTLPWALTAEKCLWELRSGGSSSERGGLLFCCFPHAEKAFTLLKSGRNGLNPAHRVAGCLGCPAGSGCPSWRLGWGCVTARFPNFLCSSYRCRWQKGSATPQGLGAARGTAVGSNRARAAETTHCCYTCGSVEVMESCGWARPGLPRCCPNEPFRAERDCGPTDPSRRVAADGPSQCGSFAACSMNAEHPVILRRRVAFLGTGVNYLSAMCFQL